MTSSDRGQIRDEQKEREASQSSTGLCRQLCIVSGYLHRPEMETSNCEQIRAARRQISHRVGPALSDTAEQAIFAAAIFISACARILVMTINATSQGPHYRIEEFKSSSATSANQCANWAIRGFINYGKESRRPAVMVQSCHLACTSNRCVFAH